jgi:hypothetical protein
VEERRTRFALGVEDRAPLVEHSAVGPDAHDRDLHDAIGAAGGQTGGGNIEHCIGSLDAVAETVGPPVTENALDGSELRSSSENDAALGRLEDPRTRFTLRRHGVDMVNAPVAFRERRNSSW